MILSHSYHKSVGTFRLLFRLTEKQVESVYYSNVGTYCTILYLSAPAELSHIVCYLMYVLHYMYDICMYDACIKNLCGMQACMERVLVSPAFETSGEG